MGRAPLTPVAHACGLFLARIEHGRDYHEPGRDCTFADAQECAAREERAKVFRSGVAQERDRPDEDVEATRCRGGTAVLAVQSEGGGGGRSTREESDAPHPLAHGQILHRQVLRPLEREEEEVEDRAKPVELGLVKVTVRPVTVDVEQVGPAPSGVSERDHGAGEGGGNAQEAEHGGLPEGRLVRKLHPGRV